MIRHALTCKLARRNECQFQRWMSRDQLDQLGACVATCAYDANGFFVYHDLNHATFGAGGTSLASLNVGTFSRQYVTQASISEKSLMPYQNALKLGSL